jgi:hypothetical protein
MSNVIKILPLGAEVSVRTVKRTEGQTDRYDEANIHFLQFCERANQLGP